MADNYFCLELGEKYTKAVDASLINGVFEVNNIGMLETGEFYFSNDTEKSLENQANIIKKLVESLKINKKNVNIIIPDSQSYNQILTMPYLNEKELISAVKYQADQFIPMPVEEANIDLEVIKEYKEEKKILILIVAAAKKIIEKVQSTIEIAGLIPESIETELSANLRFFHNFGSKIQSKPIKSFLIMNFGLNSSGLSYFEGEDATLIETHNLSFGYQLFLKETQVNTDTDTKKAMEILRTYDINHPSSYSIETIVSPLIHELSLALKRFINVKKPELILLMNNAIYFPALASLLTKSLNLPTAIYNPQTLIKKSPVLDQRLHELPLFISGLAGNIR